MNTDKENRSEEESKDRRTEEKNPSYRDYVHPSAHDYGDNKRDLIRNVQDNEEGTFDTSYLEDEEALRKLEYENEDQAEDTDLTSNGQDPLQKEKEKDQPGHGDA